MVKGTCPELIMVDNGNNHLSSLLLDNGSSVLPNILTLNPESY
jgi:hypothetical protein